MNDNVRPVPDIAKDKLLGALENMKRNYDLCMEYEILMARKRYDVFSAHIKAGFTREEALSIVMAVQK